MDKKQSVEELDGEICLEIWLKSRDDLKLLPADFMDCFNMKMVSV